MGWARHVARRRQKRNAYRAYAEKSKEKRQFGRRRLRSIRKDNIKKDGGVAQDKDK